MNIKRSLIDTANFIRTTPKLMYEYYISLWFDSAGNPSTLVFIAMAGFHIFIIGTLFDCWMAFHGRIWQHYTDFANITGGGSMLTKAGQFFVDSKYNSPDGKSPSLMARMTAVVSGKPPAAAAPPVTPTAPVAPAQPNPPNGNN